MFRKKLEGPPPGARKPKPTSIVKEQQQPSIPVSSSQHQKATSQLWVDAYRPPSLNQLIGNTGQFNTLNSWLAEWPNEKRMVVLQGTCGIGKTCAARLVCKQYGYTVHEFNSSDECYGSGSQLHTTINKLINPTTSSFQRMFVKTLNPNKQAILFDEMDEMTFADGGLAYMIKLAATSPIPLLATVNELDYTRYKTLWKSKDVLIIKLSNRTDNTYQNKFLQFARQILRNEGKQIPSDDYLKQIIRTLKGDVRASLNYLQFANLYQHTTTTSNSSKNTKLSIEECKTDGASQMMTQEYMKWMLTNQTIQFTPVQLSLYDQHAITAVDFLHDQTPRLNSSLYMMETVLDSLSEANCYEYLNPEKKYVEYDSELSMFKNLLFPLAQFHHCIKEDEIEISLPFFLAYPEVYEYQKKWSLQTELNVLITTFSRHVGYACPLYELREYSTLCWTHLTVTEWKNLYLNKNDLDKLVDNLHGLYSCKQCTKHSFISDIPSEKWRTTILDSIGKMKHASSSTDTNTNTSKKRKRNAKEDNIVQKNVSKNSKK